MTILNIFLFCVLGLCAGWVLYTGRRNRKRLSLNEQIADELDIILHNLLNMVKEAAQKRRPGLGVIGTPGNDDLSSPEMLSTLVTVLVSKFGNVTLDVHDFTAVAEEEYVSVYVDSDTKEIILSLDNTLSASTTYTMAPFGNTDDTTFH
jgi:hypothetical protein